MDVSGPPTCGSIGLPLAPFPLPRHSAQPGTAIYSWDNSPGWLLASLRGGLWLQPGLPPLAGFIGSGAKCLFSLCCWAVEKGAPPCTLQDCHWKACKGEIAEEQESQILTAQGPWKAWRFFFLLPNITLKVNNHLSEKQEKCVEWERQTRMFSLHCSSTWQK